jgi:adenosine deaminase
LAGSINLKTIIKLIEQKNDSFYKQYESILKEKDRSIDKTFKLFECINYLTDDLQTVEHVTFDVLHDFASDNVKYLELRTTPRARKGYTKKEYIECVLKTIQKYQEMNPNHFVKVNLLLSVNRSLGLKEAEECISLVEEFYGNGVTGIDFSGNPMKNSFKEFETIFKRVKHLNLTVHFAEVVDEEDSLDILKFKPQRLGHASCMTSKVEEELFKTKIPIEICVTSNLLGTHENSVKSLDQHPVKTIHKNNHPIIICV